jgi:adenine-specific DNA-methyltransferase
VAEKIKARTVVRQTTHPSDSRSNIPTAELESFARPEEKRPAIVRYPRDPTLDPQLVWKGKDDQDSRDLEVPAVPIYIQETVDPLALVEEIRAESEGRRSEAQLGFFAPYSELQFSEKVEFYKHSGKWSNRLILGDSLLVMTSLAEKEGLKGQVQTIYIDPPYGIKFGSNWQVSTRRRNLVDGRDSDLTRQPEQVRAYRDTWELGIHSYLAYLRDRLAVARELLTQSGSVFVQIGDENVHLVRAVIDEVFGAANFVSQIAFSKTGSLTGEFVSSVTDYLLWYGRDKRQTKFRKIFDTRAERGEEDFTADPLKSEGFRTGTTFDYEFLGRVFRCKDNEHWKVTREGLDRLALADRLVPLENSLRFKKFWQDFPVKEFTNVWQGLGGATDLVYVVQTNRKLIERCFLMTTDPGDLVIDPTCGSGTSAYVAEQWGRRWITIDTSRVALALARSRLMAAKYPYYLLADSEAGIRKEAELTAQAPPTRIPPTSGDVRRGFVYRRVPHVTLKSIAQNSEIGEGMSREEIDGAIARHAESETGRRRTVRHEHPRQPPPRRRPEHEAQRAPRVHPARPLPGRLRPGSWGVRRERPGEDGGDRDRAGIRHRGPRARP